jgi:hypothetical protein
MMLKINYKGRIYKSKLSGRTLRYIAADQLARTFPMLQERWAFPLEAVPVETVAETAWSFPTISVHGPYPDVLQKLFPLRRLPVEKQQNVFKLRDVVVTGHAGAVTKDGYFVCSGAAQMWAQELRPRPYKRRHLRDGRLHYNLLCSATSRGHIFHRLFDSLIPLLTWLESGVDREKLVILVNAELSAFQSATIDAVLRCYPELEIEKVAPDDAVFVPQLLFTAFSESDMRALQVEAGLAKLASLAEWMAAPVEDAPYPKRIYISRDDARLRRVADEARIMEVLAPHGFEKVVLRGRPIAEQVAMFRNADIIFGPHGAGLAHTAWCRPGTAVCEIFPSPDGPRGAPRNSTDDYWLIAKSLGLRYVAALGGPVLDRRDRFEIGAETARRLLQTVLS